MFIKMFGGDREDRAKIYRPGEGSLRGHRMGFQDERDTRHRRQAGLPYEGCRRSLVLEPQRALWAAPKSGKKAQVGETDARQVFHRLARTWQEWGQSSGYFDSEE